jgi:hypothetical protein
LPLWQYTCVERPVVVSLHEQLGEESTGQHFSPSGIALKSGLLLWKYCSNMHMKIKALTEMNRYCFNSLCLLTDREIWFLFKIMYCCMFNITDFHVQLLTLLFADDKVIISNTDDNLQKAAHKLHQITEYDLTISAQKTKSMAFKGRDPVTSKIVIDNKITEQVNSFNYVEQLISYEQEMNIDNELYNYLKITGITNNVFRPKKALKKTRIKLYSTLALPSLFYGSENWTIKARAVTRITAAEIKYKTRTAGYNLTDHKTNI